MSRLRIGIDIGGTGIKAAVVDLDRADLASNRERAPTPTPANPELVADAVASLLQPLDAPGTLGIGFPAVVVDGVASTANNIDKSWIGTSVKDVLEERLGRGVVVTNDADAAGLAEATFGAARGRPGKVLVLTFGTGIGSALIFDGQLVPNLELGQMEFEGVTRSEERFSAKARETLELDWETWGGDIGRYMRMAQKVVNADQIIVGGGVVKKWDRFGHVLPVDLPIVKAELRNNAGIVGAALAAEMAASVG